MFGPIFYEANEPSSACRLWRIYLVETSTPPLSGTGSISVIWAASQAPSPWGGAWDITARRAVLRGPRAFPTPHLWEEGQGERSFEIFKVAVKEASSQTQNNCNPHPKALTERKIQHLFFEERLL